MIVKRENIKMLHTSPKRHFKGNRNETALCIYRSVLLRFSLSYKVR